LLMASIQWAAAPGIGAGAETFSTPAKLQISASPKPSGGRAKVGDGAIPGGGTRGGAKIPKGCSAPWPGIKPAGDERLNGAVGLSSRLNVTAPADAERNIRVRPTIAYLNVPAFMGTLLLLIAACPLPVRYTHDHRQLQIRAGAAEASRPPRGTQDLPYAKQSWPPISELLICIGEQLNPISYQ